MLGKYQSGLSIDLVRLSFSGEPLKINQNSVVVITDIFMVSQQIVQLKVYKNTIDDNYVISTWLNTTDLTRTLRNYKTSGIES